MAGLMMQLFTGNKPDIHVYLVDRLPENPIASSLNAAPLSMCVYVLRETGEWWISEDGMNYRPAMADTSTFLGKFNDVSELTEFPTGGYFTVIKENPAQYTYGIVDTNNTSSIMVCKNGEWIKFVPESETPATLEENVEDPELLTNE
jgi:hypothetical protein